MGVARLAQMLRGVLAFHGRLRPALSKRWPLWADNIASFGALQQKCRGEQEAVAIVILCIQSIDAETLTHA